MKTGFFATKSLHSPENSLLGRGGAEVESLEDSTRSRSAGVGLFPCSNTPLKSPLVQVGTIVSSNAVPQRGMRGSSGKGTLGCLFSLFVIVALGYFGYKFIPHYMSHYELKDALNEIAVYRAAGTQLSSEKQTIQEEVIAKAKELGIPLRREDIKVRQESEKVYITVKYTVPVDLPNQVYNLDFEFTGHN